jgi:Cu-processing system ATP-binding protein
VLVLDEPTTGLDPEATRAFYQTLRQLRDDGVTMIITSHILAELQERVDRLAILSAGRIQALGSVQELREHMDLPLRLEVLSSAGGADAVQAALVSLPVQDLRRQDQRWHGNCPRDAKMAVLAAMAALNGAVRDVVVHEPSLEDVFFGIAD